MNGVVFADFLVINQVKGRFHLMELAIAPPHILKTVIASHNPQKRSLLISTLP
ncbi:hypothetical protein [Anabaena azotica]|uniref:hypothetical protein n=1 Tax=Anabaena azotica TaxID=197653 RepID=UPI0039A5AE6A